VPDSGFPHFDLIVIGGGPAGSHVAEGAADAGMSVALVEADQLGGTCLNYGCDPMNTLVEAARVLRSATTADRFGIETGGVRLDWSSLRRRVEAMIGTIRDRDGVEDVRAKGITFVRGRATFLSETEISVGDQVLSADRFLIATGSDIAPPDIDGINEAGYLSHRDVFQLDELPSSLIVLGSGGNALEFAQTFSTLGVDVTVVTADSALLPREDADIVEALTGRLERDGLEICLDATPLAISRDEDGVALVVEGLDGDKIVIEADDLLVATERVPLVDDLALDAAGVAWSAKGVHVNGGLRTTAPHIWAAGDVTGIYAFTHVAHYQAAIALHNMLHPSAPRKADYRVVPWKVFTHPELARVGLTEAEARAGAWDVVTSMMDLRDLPRPMTLGEREGLVKLVVDRETRQILGGHVLGEHASEVIQQVALAMEQRLPVTAIAETLHVHPAMSEAVYWAAQNVREELARE
jgi:pyruvate/2-oxoglutarate dehydrogenase complex dihydrolipoamide dehydrogenase (E3) component